MHSYLKNGVSALAFPIYIYIWNIQIAIILYPRYKLKLLEYFFPPSFMEVHLQLNLTISRNNDKKNNMKRLCYSLFKGYQAKTKGIVENSTSRANDIDLNLNII